MTDSDGDTPLFVCEQRETAKVLVEEFGADFSHTNQEGQTVSRGRVGLDAAFD